MQILGLIFAQMCIFSTQNTIKSHALYEYYCIQTLVEALEKRLTTD